MKLVANVKSSRIGLTRSSHHIPEQGEYVIRWYALTPTLATVDRLTLLIKAFTAITNSVQSTGKLSQSIVIQFMGEQFVAASVQSALHLDTVSTSLG
jgi:hypothetical protein